ncbi:MAG: hypothetical protein F4X14_01775 [Caldilineaceae bacterium SB0661_bin_32]|uniref:Collagen-like protein n=1 Tax=Caldilineaceae bacterium SB0661_bin_32 TaxID=2605255 RepID=A0A6B1D2N4_9CHLR|nr:hypothetical protein [Caldilineaceae bacterium SB0661_bin_32]
MKTFRIFLALTLMLSTLAVTATAHAHPNLPGYCQMPDGTLNSGHCTDAENAAGGHDVHLPANPAPNTGNSNTPPPPGGNDGDGTNGPPPVGSGPDGDGDGDGDGGGGGGSGSTPVYTGIDCHIQHAARPAQICSVPNGLQYWYIGADGSAQPGPFLPDSPRIESFSGTNPMTGKSVTIDYVTEGDKVLLRVQTYYPDNEYDTNKPYVFTLDAGHNVNHIQW